MSRSSWFAPVQFMFNEALGYYSLFDFYLVPMPSNVDTELEALRKGEKQGRPFRTHNAKAQFQCYKCGKKWPSSFTTVVWRARWSSGRIEMAIEKQRCRKCELPCQGSFTDDDHIAFAADCMCLWLLGIFYGIEQEKYDDDYEDDEDGEEPGGPPHDCERCEAGKKGICKKCNDISRRYRRLRTSVTRL